MVENLEWLGHASFKITGEKIVYIDPFKIKDTGKADIILVTHEHFDHYNPEDIAKIQKEDTVIVAPEYCKAKLKRNVETIRPNSKKAIKGIMLEAVPSYNIGKEFHQKQKNWVGYIITINGKRIYHAGDTDKIPEMEKLRNIDVALLPIGGTYTMTVEEAAEAANLIKAKITIPMHYGGIIGKKEDAEKFKRLVKGKVEILG